MNDEVQFYLCRSALLDHRGHLNSFIVFFLKTKIILKNSHFLGPSLSELCDGKYSDLFHPRIVLPLLSVRVPAFRLL